MNVYFYQVPHAADVAGAQNKLQALCLTAVISAMAGTLRYPI